MIGSGNSQPLFSLFDSDIKIWDVADVQQAEDAAQQAMVCRVAVKITDRVVPEVVIN